MRGQDEMAEEALKLRGDNEKDLEVISACLQDALTRLEDMHYDGAKRRFAAIFSRFMWERQDRNLERQRKGGRRVRCGIHFNDVLSVRTQGIARDNREGLLALLSISAAAGDSGSEVTLLFAGGGAIRLDVECIDAQLSDIGATWQTPSRPDHGLELD